MIVTAIQIWSQSAHSLTETSCVKYLGLIFFPSQWINLILQQNNRNVKRTQQIVIFFPSIVGGAARLRRGVRGSRAAVGQLGRQ